MKKKRNIYNLERIKKIINKYEYISFDMFDTLIKRNVGNVNNVFKFIQKEYNRTYDAKIENFSFIRKMAEENAIKKYKEPTIDEIYSEFEIKDTIIVDRLKRLEQDVELNVCQQNKDFYDIYKYCNKSGKKIIITTDMYLPRDCIIKILNKANIKYNYIFISSESHCTKKDGSLFKYVLDKLKIEKKQVCHIGDSKKGDYIIPKIIGITSILIPKKINKLWYSNKNENKLLSTYLNVNLNEDKGELYKLGFQTLGPILYFYSKYLIEKLEENEINQVYFLAREGWILKKAFDIVNDCNSINTNYFCASRQSLRIPLLCEMKNLEETKQLLQMRRIVTINDFFISIGLNIEDYIDIIKKYEYNYETNINDKNFENFYNEIFPSIKENSEKRKENLIGYLNQFKFEGNIAISDIGWKGTMQKSLKIIFKDCGFDVEINGFYVGLNDLYKENPEYMNMHQYLFNKENEYQKVRAFLNLFESLFLANHGTTLYYSKKENEYFPILDEYEYNNEESSLYRQIQEGALEFVKIFNENIFKDFYNPKPSEVFSYVERLGLHPNKYDVNLFGKIPYIETTKNCMANPRKFTYYILHPKKYYIDFCNSSWKIGFLKKSLKVNIDYFKVYKLLNIFSNKNARKSWKSN